MENRCIRLFCKFWNQGDFLTGNGLYVYKENDLSPKELYLKKRLTTFIKELGYVRGVVPRDEISNKRLKRLIQTRLLMNADSKRKGRLSTVSFLCLCHPLSVFFTSNSWHFDKANSNCAKGCRPFECSSVGQCSRPNQGYKKVCPVFSVGLPLSAGRKCLGVCSWRRDSL